MSSRRLIGKPISQLNQWTSTDYLLFITSRSIVAAGLLLMQDPLIAPPKVQLQKANNNNIGGLNTVSFAPPTQQPAQTEQAAQAGFFSKLFGTRAETQPPQPQ